jgi:hypothetical protein
MWDGGAAAGHIVVGSAAVLTGISNSNIEGDSTTLNSDPLYISEKGPDSTAGTVDDNTRLSCSSPSINQGLSSIFDDLYDVDDDTDLDEPVCTVDREARILQGTSDQGAYEGLGTTCAGDITGDGDVDVFDILAVVTSWGPCPPPSTGCPADINGCGGDGTVGVADLLLVIAQYGPNCQGGGTVPENYNDCANACAGLSGSLWQSCMGKCFAALCARGHTEFCDD